MPTARKPKPLTATYEKDTARGKRRYRLGEAGDGGGVFGTLYVEPDDPRAEHDTLTVEIKGAPDE
jgi:hypothetical protein